jgi:hypothetical protein
MMERRIARRFEITVPVMCWGSSAKCFDGRTRDVSATGIYMITHHELEPKEWFLLLMRFPGLFPDENNSLLWAYCRVVRTEPKSIDGVACVGIAAIVEQFTLPSFRSAAMRSAVPESCWPVS